MESKTIIIKSKEEIENITGENITLDASLFSHRKALKYIIEMLTSEVKAIDNAVLDKVHHEKVKTPLFYTIITDYMKLDEKRLENEKPEIFNEYKTKPVHTEQVRSK